MFQSTTGMLSCLDRGCVLGLLVSLGGARCQGTQKVLMRLIQTDQLAEQAGQETEAAGTPTREAHGRHKLLQAWAGAAG